MTDTQIPTTTLYNGVEMPWLGRGGGGGVWYSAGRNFPGVEGLEHRSGLSFDLRSV